MTTWDEIRTAYHVARLGTVSGAAAALGVHHATVIRHIDALEERLGVKLFQRHARGYTATEAGSDLLVVAQATDDQFAQLVSRIRGHGNEVSGDLIVTSLASLSFLLTPVLVQFQQAHPDVVVRSLTDERVFRLEYGEAHVAIRAGAAPQEPDNVVQPFVSDRFALYASADYIARHGRPERDGDLAAHWFVGHDNAASRAPFHRWMHDAIPAERIVFRGTDERVFRDAIRAGAGIGFLPVMRAQDMPDLVQVLPPRPEWTARLWLVTHVDLHRTTKVQAFLNFLKRAAKDWPSHG
ncbi:LysR family transcriptional regulator [Rhodobacteraceae bacterium CCMM004]|nr:LysR family transcriptional regulator [Rhodobacteraceae bacterium CCMM004]